MERVIDVAPLIDTALLEVAEFAMQFNLEKQNQNLNCDRSQGKPLSPSVTEIIHQMRDERDEQLMQACFPER